MKLAIIGSVLFTDYEFMFNSIIKHIKEITEIISGGAKGADTLSEQIALHYNLPHKHIHAEWNEYGKRAGPMRNTLIIEEADILVAFPLRSSKGTYDSITKARKKRIPVFVYMK